MKDRKIQTKRKAKKGFRALYAKTVQRKQQASTTADPEELEGDIPQVGIGRALTVILILHVVAIAAIYMGTKWKGSDSGSNSVVAIDKDQENASSQSNSNQRHRFRVDQPRSYQQYQQQQRNPQVTNQQNGHQMPAPALQQNRNGAPVAQQQVGRPVQQQQRAVAQPAPRRAPRVIRPKRNPNAVVLSQPRSTSYKSYKVVSGDTIYRIAQKNKVKPAEILNLNNIADARKLRIGMTLKVPVK